MFSGQPDLPRVSLSRNHVKGNVGQLTFRPLLRPAGADLLLDDQTAESIFTRTGGGRDLASQYAFFGSDFGGPLFFASGQNEAYDILVVRRPAKLGLDVLSGPDEGASLEP